MNNNTEQLERQFKGVWIPAEIYLNEELTITEKVLYAEIDSLCSTESGCLASNEYFAEFLHCSESKVSKGISKLIKLGYVEIISFDGRTRSLGCIAKNSRKTSKKSKSASQKVLGRLAKSTRQTSKKCQDINIDNKYSLLYSKENNKKKSGEESGEECEEECEEKTSELETPILKEEEKVAPKEEESKTKSKKFVKPTVEEIREYITEKGYGVDAESFYDFYESKGWVVGKSPMKDWHAAVRNWQRNNFNNKKGKENQNGRRQETTGIDGYVTME